jgi:hypothetical protein
MYDYISTFNIIIRCQVKILDRCRPYNITNVKLKLSYEKIITILCVEMRVIYIMVRTEKTKIEIEFLKIFSKSWRRIA